MMKNKFSFEIRKDFYIATLFENVFKKFIPLSLIWNLLNELKGSRYRKKLNLNVELKRGKRTKGKGDNKIIRFIDFGVIVSIRK